MQPTNLETKEAVSVAEMARMVGLSRARFYQLIGSAFPYPVYDVYTRRRFFDQEAQRLCLEVRRRNCGVDGKPIMFYCRHAPRPAPKGRPANVQNLNTELLDGLKSLGLAVSPGQAVAAIKVLFPMGTAGVEPGEVIRRVFIHLKAASA